MRASRFTASAGGAVVNVPAALLHWRPPIMKRILLSVLVLLAIEIAALQAVPAQISNPPDQATPQEKHLRNVHQLTFGGQNAEAYLDRKSVV